MNYKLEEAEGYKYLELGEDVNGTIVILYGLMGEITDFAGVLDRFPEMGYKVIVIDLPIYTYPMLKTNIKNFAKLVKDHLVIKGIKKPILLGNSLGGHIALYLTAFMNEDVDVSKLILTGSSGLYENSMGDSYPRRGDYAFLKNKVESVFYDPAIAKKERVDDLFKTVNDRGSVLRILSLAKSAIRHNMAGELTKIKIPVCLIWGKQDGVTPPEVGEEFNSLLPNSSLYWIDKCGHAAMLEHPEEFNDIMAKWLKLN